MKHLSSWIACLMVFSTTHGQVREQFQYKELHSPVLVDLDASMLQHLDTVEFDKWLPVPGLEPFYCDGATILSPEMMLHRSKKSDRVEASLRFRIYVPGGKHDKYLGFSFSLVLNESASKSIDDSESRFSMEVKEGHLPRTRQLKFVVTSEELRSLQSPKIRISMDVEDG